MNVCMNVCMCVCMYKVRPDIVTYNAFLHTCAKGAHVHGCVLVRRAWRMLQVLYLPACLSLCLSVSLSLSLSLSLSVSLFSVCMHTCMHTCMHNA